MRAILAGLAIGSSITAIVACGGTQKPNGMTERNEIGDLWIQIRGWRSEARMELDPPAHMMQMLRGKNVRDVVKSCQPGHDVPTRCNDICSIADNICDNAERICTLADQLGRNDSYAQEKCTSAKASCQEATQRCCGCSDDETHVPSGATGGVQGSLW